MKVLSLFSGIGAFEKALTNLGVSYELVGFSEIDKWAIQSYCAIHDVDESLNLGDASEIKEEDLPDADLITYGFPCQDISVAGKGKGISEDTRSGLLYEAERIIEHAKPKYAIAENVKNLVGKRHKEDFEELLERLEGYGYNNYWEVLNAKDFGIPQNRERVFIISIRKDIDGELEFPKGFDSGLRLKDFLLDEVEDKYYINNNQINRIINSTFNQAKTRIQDGNKDVSTLLARDYKDPKCIIEPRVCEQRTDEGLRFFKGDYVGTLRTIDSGGDKRVIEPNELRLHKNLSGGKWDKIHESARRVYEKEGVAPTIPTCAGGNTEPKVYNNYKIRKLTPQECWRLMGFEDEDYWVARRRLEEVFYNGGDRSNSQMYKQAGNSIVVDVLEDIFKQLL